ncbi:hypothetical protein PVIIG_05895 [Plasmodium vivax India VII]|uniref:Variable surface protein Vir35 n=1 Tax=Plasmodium vivax India VII TaxID=1077284 RepID=A0A0J9S3P9_PLAVI|nr:hypothetical protein PVIIG_05895 [Plasmodium vivax India VII]
MDIRYNRLLTKRDFQKGLENKILRDDLHGYEKNKEIKTEKAISTYGSLKPEGLNYYDTYKKNYKKRYSKKKGLAKLDCYCEKKVFDKIDNILKLADKLQNDKKYFKKKIRNKYIIPFIVFGLLPLLGVILPILFWESNPLFKNYCFNDCKETHGSSKSDITEIHNDKKRDLFPFDENTFVIFKVLNYIYLCVTLIIAIMVPIYVLWKFIKYEGLKAGKSRMNFKEYYHLLKN